MLDSLRRWSRAGLAAGAQSPPNSSAEASFRKKCGLKRGIFRHFLCGREPVERTGVSYRGTSQAGKMRSLDSISPKGPSGEISMVITTAHISPIISLIAGVLILIMPRLLNLIVAIYLICIGLIGLGALTWLHQ
jgi:Protein of unknown function (DUF3096)